MDNLEINELDQIVAIEALKESFPKRVLKRYEDEGIMSFINEYENIVLATENEVFIDKRGNVYENQKFKSSFGISYEYVFFLVCRDVLEVILDSVSSDQKDIILQYIYPLDERLKIQLVDEVFFRNKKVIDKFPKDKYWWYYGLPKCVDP